MCFVKKQNVKKKIVLILIQHPKANKKHLKTIF